MFDSIWRRKPKFKVMNENFTDRLLNGFLLCFGAGLILLTLTVVIIELIKNIN